MGVLLIVVGCVLVVFAFCALISLYGATRAAPRHEKWREREHR